MLREFGHPQVAVRPHVARARRQLAVDNLDEGALTGSVGPDESDARVQVKPELDISVERGASRVAKAEAVHLQHRRRDVARVGEAELEEFLVHGLFGKAPGNLLVEQLLLRLGLPRVRGGTVAEPRHVLLHTLDVLLLGVVPLQLVGVNLFPGLHELVVVAPVVLERLGVGLKVHDMSTHVVQEVLRVTDHEKHFIPLGKVALEPHHSLHVKVVSRLVEQQELWLDEQGAGEGHAHAPAA
mmetsp:Transcript_24346/g.65833  ORF Transcript_24346/g.65833 Transcript_24346/m.65833 type:complete len:240 (-) Transcript_24346:686-1405(-)